MTDTKKRSCGKFRRTYFSHPMRYFFGTKTAIFFADFAESTAWQLEKALKSIPSLLWNTKQRAPKKESID